ncbi:transmembrane protein, putative (macronuclear) [Tetrahymena thermophila SB210]|uniref:Transmembrane protein, putative n=1 Tax=Tetrahymena thermophila (strain SB210) TaxID=312017 RepID=Q23RX7_TETTS|nr:transmembrane protein, putative [Tetrahymena thermophila SB210]EAR99262.2 transmembrane protein, putative [Tetrahymena thermophila SB210]|eukprot:XP_001019507.2 transmembrane protein, putative [Tetrahymena thermophila SB210]
MSVEIQLDCESVFGCMKGIIVTVYSLIVIAIICRIIYKMHFYTHKKYSFELVPLSSTIIQSLLQLILNVFIMDTKLIISALYSQALTFGIISTSCSQLCLRIKYPHKQKTVKRYTVLAFGFAQLTCLVMNILTLSDVVPLDCNDWFSLAYLYPMGVMLVYTVFSIFFGSTLLDILKVRDNEVMKGGNNANKTSQQSNPTPDGNNHLLPPKLSRAISLMNNSVQSDKEGAFFKQLKKQLQLIEFLFIFTIAIQISMDAIRTYALNDVIECQGDGERSNEFQAQTDWGQVFLTFYQIIQITPCLIAPYVFYYVPFKAKKAGGSILIQDQQFLSFAMPNDQDDEDENMQGSLDSKLMNSENFDFSRDENFSQNYKNKKKFAGMIKKKDQADQKEQPALGSHDYLGVNQYNNKSQKSNISNNNNTPSNASKKNQVTINKNVDSIFLQRRNTLEDVDEFIDRMSMKVDDVQKLNNQSHNQSQSYFLNKSHDPDSSLSTENIVKDLSESIQKIDKKNYDVPNNPNFNINTSDNTEKSDLRQDTTVNETSQNQVLVDQYRETDSSNQMKKNYSS